MDKKENLQEILELLQENFPKINREIFIKIIFTLKSRAEKFEFIWFSRKEFEKFKIWESKLQEIIYFLRDFWILEKIWTKVITPKWNTSRHNCNLYKVSSFFKNLLDSLEFFTKNIFEYVNPLEFVKKFFNPKFKYWLYKFEVNWNKYFINTKWKFSGKIFWLSENKIINPLKLST